MVEWSDRGDISRREWGCEVSTGLEIYSYGGKLLEMRWGTLRVSSSVSVFEPQVLGLFMDYCAKNWNVCLTLICHQTHMMIHLNSHVRTS